MEGSPQDNNYMKIELSPNEIEIVLDALYDYRKWFDDDADSRVLVGRVIYAIEKQKPSFLNSDEKVNVAGMPDAFERLYNSLPDKDKRRE